MKRRLFSNSLLFFVLALSQLTGCAPSAVRERIASEEILRIEAAKAAAVRAQEPAGENAPSENSRAGALQLDGLVSRDGRGFAGAQVELYALDSFAATAEAPRAVASATSENGGRFLLEAPSGNYILLARATDAFGFFGRNPLRLAANQRGLSLPLVVAHPARERAVEPGGENVFGRVLHNGAPVVGAQVFAYLEIDKGFRGTPYASSAPTGDDGAYRLELEPGRYFLAARKRFEERMRGPMSSGDLFGVEPNLPLRLKAGTALGADIELVEIPSPERMARYTTRFSKLSGVVTDAEGRPVAGFRVCLYNTPRMIDEPLEVSDPTGEDGRFHLSSTRTGSFWLGAREKLGGPPGSGERVGFLSGGASLDLTPGIERGELRIVVKPVP